MLNDMLDILELEAKYGQLIHLLLGCRTALAHCHRSVPLAHRRSSSTSDERIGGFDLVYRDGLVRKGDASSMYTTFLGAEVNRGPSGSSGTTPTGVSGG